MSTTDNDRDQGWESEMGDVFERRVRDLHEAPLDLGAVQGTARRIRRKRRAAVAGGVLAVAAVVVPVGVIATGAADQRVKPVGPAATVTATEQAPADPGALGVGYLEQRTYHRADGTAVELPRDYQSATAFGDDVLAGRYDEQAQQLVVDVVDAVGGVVDTYGVLTSPVSDRDEELVAFVDLDGSLVVRWPGSTNVLDTGLSGNTQVVAVTGGPTCEPGSECRVYLDDDTLEDGLRVVTSDREVEPLPDGIVDLGDVTDGGVAAVTTSVSEDLESCGGLYDLDTARLLVDSCDYSFLGVSPDGELADAAPSYRSGFGIPWAAIVDRDGAELARYTPDGGQVTDQAWQDDEHLLVVAHVFDSQEWTIVRLGADGSQEVVAGPLQAPSEAYPFRLG